MRTRGLTSLAKLKDAGDLGQLQPGALSRTDEADSRYGSVVLVDPVPVALSCCGRQEALPLVEP